MQCEMIARLLRPTCAPRSLRATRAFSATPARLEIRDISELPDRVQPTYRDTPSHDLLSLHWPSPPRNILLTKKDGSTKVTESLIECARHITSTYPSISIILEPEQAAEVHESLSSPVYTAQDGNQAAYTEKTDLISTFGGDGTILHASALFAKSANVPPVVSFSMGTLGFLGEWKFSEYKRAFREVYMSGAGAGFGHERFRDDPIDEAMAKQENSQDLPSEWESLRGKSMGSGRSARVLLRNRLKVQIVSTSGEATTESPIYAMNEVIIHRGRNPHLAIVDVTIGGKFLTSAVADGMIVSTPTGSTAYSLSSGGSIVHPLVPSLLLTPICPRSLSFRPLVLPAQSPISLRLSQQSRGKEVEVSIDGVRQEIGLGKGMEVKVWGEGIQTNNGDWYGGVPSVVRGTKDHEAQDHWVGGLNGLLKFNYPFGEE